MNKLEQSLKLYSNVGKYHEAQISYPEEYLIKKKRPLIKDGQAKKNEVKF